jgi:uncharacterized protein YuzE
LTRTLILAQGLELARLFAAVNKHGANRVIIIRNTCDLTEKLREIIQKLVDSFEKELLSEKDGFKPFPSVSEIDSKSYATDFFNLPEATSMIYSLVQKELELGNDVAIDISSGTKIMAIAMFLAAQFSGTPVSYCIAGRYSVEDTPIMIPQRAQIAASSGKAYDIPRFPLKLIRVSFNLLEQLAGTPTKEVSSITDLVCKNKQRTTRTVSRSELMSATRELDTLEYYEYVKRSRPPGQKNTSVKLTKDGEKIIALRTLKDLLGKTSE